MARQKKMALTPASFGKTLYRFVAKNSLIIPAIIRGFPQNLKFSVSFEGSAHFSTSDVDKAEAIRNCALFKKGAIREIESVPVDGAPKVAPAKKAGAKPAAWMQSIKSVKGGAAGTKAENTKDGANGKAEKSIREETSASGGTLFDGTNDQPGPSASEAVAEDTGSGLTLGEVDNYTDAVNYLRDEMGMPDEVLSRDEVAAWAASNGVTFPNFQF